LSARQYTSTILPNFLLKSPDVCPSFTRVMWQVDTKKSDAVHQVQPAHDDELQTELPTIEALAKERAQRKAELVAEKERARAGAAENTQGNVAEGEGGVQELEEEAGQQGAFNPVTGEINWDCPCLGGMATGPCGEQFKAAFSCFVHSEEEPKGMDCVDKFKYVRSLRV
jgi:intermembrane space import and assembly protein 40